MSPDAETNLENRSPADEAKKLRLFVGISIDEQVRQELAAVQDQLQGCIGRIRWVPMDNLHLTLRFLGPVEKPRVVEITESLTDALSGRGKIDLRIAGLGVFPNLRRARILWAGLTGEGLEPLVECVEAGLERLGFPRESRPFQPHLTVGRWRVPERDPSRIVKALAHWQGHRFGSFFVTRVNLFHSALGPTGASYSVVRTFDLSGQNRFPTHPQEQP